MNDLEKRVLRLIGEDPDNPDVFVDIQESESDSADSEKNATYLQNWEADELTDDELVQVLKPWEIEQATFSHGWEDRFEASTIHDDSEDSAITQPWEGGDTNIVKESPLQMIRNSINDAIQEICMVSGAYKRVYHLTLKTGAMFYKMDWSKDYFGWVMEAWDRSRHRRLEHIPLSKLRVEDADFLKTSGPADVYFHVGADTIGIYRKPSADDAVIELTCVVVPQAYTADTDPIRLRDAFEDAATYYAVSEFFASRGDSNRAVEWYARYIDSAGLSALHTPAPERPWRFGKENGP